MYKHMHTLLAAFVVILILLVIMSVVLCPFTNSIGSTLSHLIYAPTNSISIIHPDPTSNLEHYVASWGYTLNNPSAEYLLYLNDTITNINYDRHLGHFINMAGNASYIAFADSMTFITKDKSIRTYDDMSRVVNKDIIIPRSALRDILDTGFPYRTRHGIILSRHYIDNIVNSTPLGFDGITTIPSCVEPRQPSARSTIKTKIPRIIHQTFETRVLPSRLLLAVNSWLNRNPEYQYRYYDEGDRRDFIRSHFDNKILQAYDKLIPGAYKADLWRYCAIYIEGGVYVDIKMGALVPLSKIIDSDTDMVFVNDEPDDAIYNAFFASVPRNPIIHNVIMSVVSNIESEYYGISPLYPTGPVAMGKSVISHLGYNKHLPAGKTTTQHGTIQVYSFHHMEGGGRIGIDGDPPLIKTRHTPETHDQVFLHKITGLANYGVLWNEHNVYNK